MAITLLRHTAPAIGPGICYGISDIDVADSFARDAEAVTGSLPILQRVITSPLQRCRRLGEHIAAALSLPLTEDHRFQEMDFGAWEGRAWADIPRAEIDAWAADFMNARAHGGESVAMLRARTARALAELDNSEDHILIVTHAGVIRALVAAGETAADYTATIDFGRFVTLISSEGARA